MSRTRETELYEFSCNMPGCDLWFEDPSPSAKFCLDHRAQNTAYEAIRQMQTERDAETERLRAVVAAVRAEIEAARASASRWQALEACDVELPSRAEVVSKVADVLEDALASVPE